MTTESHDDDSALSWAGDEPAKSETPTVAPARAEGPATSSILLVTWGVLGGVYLIYTVGWIISVTRGGGVQPTLLGEILFQLGELLAIASPALWVVAAFALTRGRRPIVRLLWLVIGLIVVLPWPFALGV